MDYKDLVNFGTITEDIADFLRTCVEAKLNIVVSGGTGSGTGSIGQGAGSRGRDAVTPIRIVSIAGNAGTGDNECGAS